MRLNAGVFSVVVMLASQSASAQEWVNYVNPEYRFAVNFPVAPMEADIEYSSLNSASLAGRVFSADQGTSHYRVTVVHFPDGTDGFAEIEHAAEAMRTRGEANHDLLSQYDGVPAHEMSLIDGEGRQILTTILFYEERLFITEGNVDSEAFPPVQFQQSIYVTDAVGTPIDIPVE